MNNFFIISGTAGSGKGSVWAPLLEDSDEYCILKSCTTRKKRADSREESKYQFISFERFDKLIAQDKLLEYENIHGNLYGTLKSEINRGIKSGKIVLAEIDVKGALNIRKKIKNAILIFIKPSDVSEAEKRLINRKTEDKKAIEARIKRYSLELKLSKKFDYTIINDDLKKAQKELRQVIDEAKNS